jgi:hypothetical protein
LQSLLFEKEMPMFQLPPNLSLPEKMLYVGTWFFLPGCLLFSVGIFLYIMVSILSGEGIKDWSGFLLFAAMVAFPFVHIAGFYKSKICAALAALLHLGTAFFILGGMWLSFKSDSVVNGILLLLWAACHLTLAWLMFRYRARER